MSKQVEKGVVVFNEMAARLLETLEQLTASYIPPPEEAAHLKKALFHLLSARDTRDFAPDEESVWNCGSMKISGFDRGSWEIRLVPTAAPSTAARSK